MKVPLRRKITSRQPILGEKRLDTLHHANVLGENLARFTPLLPAALVKERVDLMPTLCITSPDENSVYRSVRTEGECKTVKRRSHGTPPSCSDSQGRPS
jgi:hypothetical protein